MLRLTLMLTVLVALLAGALGAAVLRPWGTEPADAAAIRSVVEQVLDERQLQDGSTGTAALDPTQLNPMIEAYLLGNPRILQDVSTALEAELRAEQSEKTRVALASLQDELYEDPEQVVLGNPDGDVTIVELFDYNCSFCRSALPDLAALLDEDRNLRVILKEFPILSQESVDAARVAVAVNRVTEDYWPFHEALFTSRGQVSGETALAAAAGLGLDRGALARDAESQAVLDVVQRSYTIAQQLNITGTPTYIIGDEVIAGAVGLEELKRRIANMRDCGRTLCNG